MTQASLSPELSGTLPASPTMAEPKVRQASTSEAALWMIALTSSGLVIASVLLLALTARGAIGDASLSGFFAGIAVVMATVGFGAMGYVLVVAKRQGLLTPAIEAASRSVAPMGMYVVPAIPADLGRRKRLQAESERAARSKQAKAIAAASFATNVPSRAPAPSPAARPQPVRPPAPRPMAAPAASAPRRQPRPGAAPAAPMGARPVHAAIQMPRPAIASPRPAAPTRAPAVRMPTPPLMPRTQATLYQVNATNVRPPTPF